MRFWTPIAAAATLALAGAGLAEAKTQVSWWHAFPHDGKLGQTLVRFTEEFNASQDEFEVVPVFKGTYYETLNAAIAAYRAKKHPAILQVIGTGAATVRASGAYYPVSDLMKDTGNAVDWSRFLAPVLAAYGDKDGPVAMPFNTSTPILWYNVDAFEKAGLTEAPKTWDALGEAARKLRAAGYPCGITSAWQIWVHRDNYSFTQDIPVASKGNGMDGTDTAFVYNQTRFVDHVTRIRDWIKDGLYTYTGRTWQGGHEAFYAQQCPLFLESSAGYGGISKNATFKFAASYLPVEADNAAPKNSFLGGAALWVRKGHDKAAYEGVAQFFKFLASAEKQLDWHKNTGYVPITIDAYELGKAQGYYKEFPHQEIAILQLNRTPPTENTRGTRFGYDVENTGILDEELENIWAMKKEPQAALDDAVRRSNENLRRFERTASASN